jgi:hypothetical protein
MLLSNLNVKHAIGFITFFIHSILVALLVIVTAIVKDKEDLIKSLTIIFIIGVSFLVHRQCIVGILEENYTKMKISINIVNYIAKLIEDEHRMSFMGIVTLFLVLCAKVLFVVIFK